MNRLGIFVFYDKEGIVDSYVPYLLSTIHEYISYTIVVCNGILTEDGERILKKFADTLYLRENKGFDAMALKMALTEYLGWEKVMSYDEVVFFNDTFYGPIFSWKEVFDKMENRKVDFWGLTGSSESADYYSLYEKTFPAFIHSYFYVFSHKVVCHPVFQEYWNNFDSTNWIFSDVTNKHEKVFTKILADQGFSWDTYVKAELFDSTNPKHNFVQYYYIPYELIKEYRCPIIKRKNFIMKHLTDNPGELGNNTLKALEYIEEFTDYDTDLIWNNLLRLYDMQDIRKTLNLNYIVPGNIETKKTADSALILWLSHEVCLPRCIAYIQCLERSLPIYIYSESEEILTTVQMRMQGWNVNYAQANKSNLYGIIFAKCHELAKMYDCLIFLQDIDYYAMGSFCLQQYSLFEFLWDNLLKNHAHVLGMEKLFKIHKKLGILTAPKPVYGTYFSSIGKDENPFFAFCCRGEAIEKIFNLKSRQLEPRLLNDYEVMNALSLELQRMGYYTASIMTTDYAMTACGQMQAILGRILQQAERNYKLSDFDCYLDAEAVAYAKRFQKVAVYGAGENGYRTACLLKNNGLNFLGFLISDGQLCGKEKYGYPVFRVSEIEHIEKLGVVVSVASPQAQKEIASDLKKYNCTDTFFL